MMNHDCVDCTCMSKCFMALAKEQQEMVSQKRKIVNYRKGEVICKQGAYASKIMFLRKGLVKTYLEHPNKDVIFCIKPGQSFIGIEALFNEREYPYTCTTYEDSEFCMFEAEMFENLIEQNGKFAATLMQDLNLWITRVYQRIITLTQKQVTGKLADILLCLSERIYQSDEFILTISRKDLSELTQLSPETLSRALREFKEEGVIALDGKEFKILDREKLEKYSEIG